MVSNFTLVSWTAYLQVMFRNIENILCMQEGVTWLVGTKKSLNKKAIFVLLHGDLLLSLVRRVFHSQYRFVQ